VGHVGRADHDEVVVVGGCPHLLGPIEDPGARVPLQGVAPASRVARDDRCQAEAGRGLDERGVQDPAAEAEAEERDAEVAVGHGYTAVPAK